MSIKRLIGRWSKFHCNYRRRGLFFPAFHSLILAIALMIFMPYVHADPFEKGSTRASFTLANGQNFNEDYVVFGAGIGHYFINGLQVGLDIDAWFGGDPDIYEVTPMLQYVVRTLPNIQPYIGIFYNRTFIENRDDSDAAGYRAGIYISAGDNMYMGYGLVYSELQDCTDTIFIDCSNTYSELSLMFTL